MLSPKSFPKNGPIKAAIVVAAALLLFLLPDPFVGGEGGYFRKIFVKTGASYAAVRGINAVVSVFKESEINVEPAGIGVTIAAGEILDPLDDLTERISTLLVYSMLALGVQEVLLQVLGDVGPLPVALLLLLSLVGMAGAERAGRIGDALLKGAALLLALQLSLPATLYLNERFYEGVLSAKIERVQTTLQTLIPQGERTDLASAEEAIGPGSIWEVGDRIERFKRRYAAAYETLEKNLKAIVSHLLELGYLYLSGFLFQVVLLPVATLLLLYRLYRMPFRFY